MLKALCGAEQGSSTHVESQRGVEAGRLAAVCSRDVEATGDEDYGKANPEAAVGAQCSATESVAFGRVSCYPCILTCARVFDLPSAISHMPPNSWMNPPYASAGATTMFG